jgi:hypothetical protein
VNDLEPPRPRWFVDVAAFASLILGAAVILNETFLEQATSPERPFLLAIAYGLVTGSAITAFLERMRKP